LWSTLIGAALLSAAACSAAGPASAGRRARAVGGPPPPCCRLRGAWEIRIITEYDRTAGVDSLREREGALRVVFTDTLTDPYHYGRRYAGPAAVSTGWLAEADGSVGDTASAPPADTSAAARRRRERLEERRVVGAVHDSDSVLVVLAPGVSHFGFGLWGRWAGDSVAGRWGGDDLMRITAGRFVMRPAPAAGR